MEKATKMWLYEKNPDNSARYVLGENGKKPLVCFGINPSTAEPNKLDRTLSRVRKIAAYHGFDGWIMLNLYPQRATNPNMLHKTIDVSLHKNNLEHIKAALRNYRKPTLWAAWGGLIGKRSFLTQCLIDIVKIAPGGERWVNKGKLCCNGHPHHPLYLKQEARFCDFNINSYLRKENTDQCRKTSVHKS